MAAPGRVLSRRVLAASLAALVAFQCTSCDKDKRRPVFPVRGQVFFESRPTPDALVIFHPVNDPDPQAPRPIGRVGADGRFTTTTYRTDDGAPAGEYLVTITWVKETDRQGAAKEEQKDPVNRLPDRYSKPETSQLRVQIKEGPNDLVPFQLTRKWSAAVVAGIGSFALTSASSPYGLISGC